MAQTWGRDFSLEAGLGGKVPPMALPRGRGPGGVARVPSCPPPPPPPASPQVLGLCGAAYRPTEEIDLRSVGWGNIFQLPFKHVRDFRLRHLVPFFIYSGFEVLFACTGIALVSAACRGSPDIRLNLNFRQ